MNDSVRPRDVTVELFSSDDTSADSERILRTGSASQLGGGASSSPTPPVVQQAPDVSPIPQTVRREAQQAYAEFLNQSPPPAQEVRRPPNSEEMRALHAYRRETDAVDALLRLRGAANDDDDDTVQLSTALTRYGSLR